MTRTEGTRGLETRPGRVQYLLLSFAVLIAAFLGWLRVSYPSTLESWDWLWYDRLAPMQVDAEDVEPYVVILVDDESLAQLGERWPMSRQTWARLIQVVGASQPAVIALSAWFERPEPMPGLEVTEELFDELDAILAENPAPRLEALLEQSVERAHRADGNRRLENAVVIAGNVILGLACINRGQGVATTAIPAWMKGEVFEAPPMAFPCANLSISYNQLGVLAAGNAGVNVSFETDGVLRRYPMYFQYQDSVFLSLATAVMAVTGRQASTLTQADWVEYDRGMPLSRPFDPQSIATSSLIDVLDTAQSDDLSPLLANKRVFIGVSAVGAGKPVRLPGYSNVPEVFAHVIAAVNAERGGFVTSHGPALAWSVVLAILGLIGLAIFAHRYSLLATVSVCAASCIVSLWLAGWALDHGTLITLVPWWAGAAGILLVVVGTQLDANRKHREESRRIRGAFQHYVAPEVIDELMQHRDKLRLGGERQEITAFFADIVGFTRLSESLEPILLVQLLNELLSALGDDEFAEGGIIDKYVGDSTVAMFGAPIPLADHGARACRAALACQEKVTAIRSQWKDRGLPAVEIRIGLNTGIAVVGNIGSENRFDFTMLGDTVNLAARIEGVNNVYGTHILVGEQTREHVGDAVVFREVDRVRVKGKHQAVSVYEPMALATDISDRLRRQIDQYERALGLFRKRQFDQAHGIFDELARGGDPPARVLRERAAAYLNQTLPDDWDGTFELVHK